jgi:glutamate synthase (NADPH/NADH) small chain
MGDSRGFLKVARQSAVYRPVCKRLQDFKEVALLRPEAQSQEQASRCMDCGTPFCHSGCPIGNYIPEWNDHLFHGRWKEALSLLEAANNLPEITGRVCPAPCEYACVLGFNDDTVTIRDNELAVIESGFRRGLLKPVRNEHATGKKAAIVGSGPAGMSCAAQLNRAGHSVTVFERDARAGGILRYGIPDFKLEKSLLDRRIALWEAEGVVFKTNTEVGKEYAVKKLLGEFDAVCLAGGSRVPRDIVLEGRQLKGIYFAMDYLAQSNRLLAGERLAKESLIDVKGKNVVVIGGGDTGSDCIGTAYRQNAACVVQIEVLPRPDTCRTKAYPWPRYPVLLKTTSSHEEGGLRRWGVLTKRFLGEKGAVKKLACVNVEFIEAPGKPCPAMQEVAGSQFEIEADVVIIAAGFLHAEHSGLLDELGVAFDERGNVKTDKSHMTSVDTIFSAGDMRRGQSLVVWAISEGRRCAYYMDTYLMGKSNLPLI